MSWARYSGVTAFSSARVFFLIRLRHVSIEPCRKITRSGLRTDSDRSV